MSYDSAALRSLVLLTFCAVAISLSGCGGGNSSSSTADSGGLTDASTCAEWNAGSKAAQRDYLSSKGLSTDSGSPGEAIGLWLDNVCGKNGSVTSFSDLTPLSEAYPAAKAKFDGGQTLPSAP